MISWTSLWRVLFSFELCVEEKSKIVKWKLWKWVVCVCSSFISLKYDVNMSRESGSSDVVLGVWSGWLECYTSSNCLSKREILSNTATSVVRERRKKLWEKSKSYDWIMLIALISFDLLQSMVNTCEKRMNAMKKVVPGRNWSHFIRFFFLFTLRSCCVGFGLRSAYIGESNGGNSKLGMRGNEEIPINLLRFLIEERIKS